MKKLLALTIFACISFTAFTQDIKLNTNLVVESDGTVRMDGNATVFEDLMVYPDATSKNGSNMPTYSVFKNDGSSSQGVFLWMFSKSAEQEVYFTVQIPHSYKIGTAIYPHVHWTTTTGTPSGTDVVWGLEYTAIQIGGSFPNTSIIYATTVIPSIGTPSGTGQHLINSFPAIGPGNWGISTVLSCRLFRATGHNNDTFDNSIGLLGFDIHFEKDTDGSRTEYTK